MRLLRPLLPFLLLSHCAVAQENLSGTAEIRLALARLNSFGSVLMIGAHPDDEHTDTLAYFARGRSMRTGYLSITRGEGGQNLIGSEQGDLLGIIRTQELLAARRVDGAEQFFTRAIDFGFSKSPDETIAKWGRDKVLSDIVRVIRRFEPDVIILCFSGTPRDGHGHHQASSILGREAFLAAADPSRFPDQLTSLRPWKARRAVWNVYGDSDRPNQIRVDTGEFDPVLGYSYAEIAAQSRSMHRSQGMGMAGRPGTFPSVFVPMAGDAAAKDLFDGIDTTWTRVAGGAPIGARIAELLRSFDPAHPEQLVEPLLALRPAIAALPAPWAARKLAELDRAVALAAGLWLDSSADTWDAVPGGAFSIRLTALRRTEVPLHLDRVTLSGSDGSVAESRDLAFNEPYTRTVTWKVPAGAPYSQPFWLAAPKQGDTYAIANASLIGDAENQPVVSATFYLSCRGQQFVVTTPVRHRYVDRARGGLDRPLAIVPAVAAGFTEPVYLLPSETSRTVELMLKTSVPGAAGELRIHAPDGWKIEPAARTFNATDAGEQLAVSARLSPPAQASSATLRATVVIDGAEVASDMRVISYPHFPPQVVFPVPAAEAVHAPVRILAHRIGYIMGAGDQIPESLTQLGCEIAQLTPNDLATADLSRFDAIIAGVRAYNVRADLRANQRRLLDYVSNGGTYLVQYNVLDWRTAPDALDKIGPYPIHIKQERVTVEDAPVAFTDPASPLLHAPNEITAADFDGWIQERGLYFAADWDPRYRTLFESHDPGEAPHAGGTLYARYGKGVYIFTAYSWFRELPAGVPGAYRVFANLLSAGKILQ